MKEVIKAYLENQIKEDPALAEKYDEEKLDACIDYIFENAKEMAVKNSVCVEDALVFKWARDFYLEGPEQFVQSPDGYVVEHRDVETRKDRKEESAAKVKKVPIVKEKKEQPEEKLQGMLFDF